jgi:hypothetical protein
LVLAEAVVVDGRWRAAKGSRMAMSMMPLLIHSESLSNEVRAALKAAVVAAPEARPAQLESAARLLHREAALDCRDIRDLMGLSPKHGC